MGPGARAPRESHVVVDLGSRLCLLLPLSLRPRQEPRIVSQRTRGPGLAGRSQSPIQGPLGAAGSEAAWKRTRAGANAECRERKQERREPRRAEARRRAGSGEEGRRPPPNALSSQGFFRLPIDHGPGRCIIHAGGNEAVPRAEEAEPGQNENEACGSA